MKIVRIIFLSLLSVVLFVACKKKDNDIKIPVADVAGVYEGKFGTGNTPSLLFIALT